MSKNMYLDSVKQWNCFVGCKFNCIYCKKSFQAQMKRQKPMIDKNGKKRGCQQCYDYEPHFHEDRLNQSLKNTKGDEFIWVGSSGDISFIEYPDMLKILNRIKKLPQIFFFQSKEPRVFYKYDFPENVILGITLESNRWYKDISDAPPPFERMNDFYRLKHPRKFITIEPILDFDFSIFLGWLRELNPERIYIGYDTHKTWWMEGKEKVYLRKYEPRLHKTRNLIHELKRSIKVKTKYMKDGR